MGIEKVRRVAGVAIPSIMITYGILSVENDALKELDYSTDYELHEDNYLLYHHYDDYMQFSPAAAAFILKLSGVQGKHNLADMTVLYALSNTVMMSIVLPMKNSFKRIRPDGSTYNSFPSGHTATAFTAAEFLNQEYGDKSIWISVGGYTMAGLIGFSRVFNDRHWISDVICGSGIGILSTKAVYWAYPYLRKVFDKKGAVVVVPTYQKGDFGVCFSYNF